jgi:hypothetical protein
LGVVRRSLIAVVPSRREAGNAGSIPGMSEIPSYVVDRRAIVPHRGGQSSTPRASGLRHRRLDRAGWPER